MQLKDSVRELTVIKKQRMLFKEFLADIKSSLKQYDSANLINDMDVYNWVIQGMRRFGNLPTIQIEKSLEVKNRKVALPEGFKSLRMALKCEPDRYECDEKAQDVLQQYYFYKTWETNQTEYSICEPCESTEKQTCVVEKIYFHNGGKANFYYKKPEWLKLVSYSKGDLDLKGCFNLAVKNSPHTISINNKTLYTNFNSGVIYIVYNGFEEDEDGFVEIPETNNGNLEQYLQYYVKRNLMEQMITNSDNTTNEFQLYQLFKADELQYFSLAKTEMKFKNIETGLKNYAKKVKREFKIYNFGTKR